MITSMTTWEWVFGGAAMILLATAMVLHHLLRRERFRSAWWEDKVRLEVARPNLWPLLEAAANHLEAQRIGYLANNFHWRIDYYPGYFLVRVDINSMGSRRQFAHQVTPHIVHQKGSEGLNAFLVAAESCCAIMRLYIKSEVAVDIPTDT